MGAYRHSQASEGGDEKLPGCGERDQSRDHHVEAVRWRNFDDVRGMFKDADLVDGYVIFNIRHNRYRLVTVIHYAKTMDKRQTLGHVYIRSFSTHKEYDNRRNWDRRYGKQ
jgi:mRNA interferase HigB